MVYYNILHIYVINDFSHLNACKKNYFKYFNNFNININTKKVPLNC